MKVQILNPKGCNPNDIQRTTHTENGVTRIVSKYPNGVCPDSKSRCRRELHNKSK